MLCKLAWGNVRRAHKDYLVYLLTLSLAVTVFYAFNTISQQIDYVRLDEAGIADFLGSVIGGLTWFLAGVMAFLMVYANNFIMKRRKKEFGLYQVLGMSRGQVARMMALETLLVSVAAFAVGIVLGVGLSQLMTFFTAALFKTRIASFHFFFSVSALAITLCCLATIFILTLVFNLRVVARSHLADLMSANRKNEAVKLHNPVVSALVCIVGAVAIGVAYARLWHDSLPVYGGDEPLVQFCITTVMVVIGTILFFYGLSGLLLKMLQAWRGLYWRDANMFTARQLAARINTLSVSMAVVSLVLFLAFTSVSGGMSISGMVNQSLERCNPFDYSVCVTYYDTATAMDQSASDPQSPKRYAAADGPVDMLSELRKQKICPAEDSGKTFDVSSIAESSLQLDTYVAQVRGSQTSFLTLGDLCRQTGVALPKGTEYANVVTSGLNVMPLSEYNAYLAMRGKPQLSLGADGYTITCDMGETLTSMYDEVLSGGERIDFDGIALHPAQASVDQDASAFLNSTMGSNPGTLIVPDAVIKELDLQIALSTLGVNYRKDLNAGEGDAYVMQPREYGSIDQNGAIVGFCGYEFTRMESEVNSNSISGLISYLAIYIGFVLVVACVAIITIQQLSNVSESAPSVRVLFELGCPRSMIMRSLNAQQAVFFVLPLIVALAHSFVALKVVVDLVAIFGGFSIGKATALAGIIFVLVYGGYYVVTFLMSKGIVSDTLHARSGE